MNNDKIEISDDSVSIEIKSKKHIVVSGVPEKKSSEIFFDVEYADEIKNAFISTVCKSKMPLGNQELRFYLRYIDDKNYCLFSIIKGQFIQFSVIGDGINKISTNPIQITKENLFKDKFSLIISLFEETTTVIIDNRIVLNIEHTPEIQGKIGVQFCSDKNEELGLTLENFNISDDIGNFEPIIEMQKSSDVYFMQGNDFYEQDRYEIALFYYRKGFLFGRGDDKIYNRMGNLLFLIEEYDSAENYYRTAFTLKPDKVEYKANLGRTYLRTGKETEGSDLLREVIEAGSEELEVLSDYAGLWMKHNNFKNALFFLEKAYEKDHENFIVLSRYGKCLIELGRIEEGKDKILKAAEIIKDKDPSSAGIILKYSITKKIDLSTLKALSKLLFNNDEYNGTYELITASKPEINMDSELLEVLINAEIKLGLLDKALDEFNRFSGELETPKIKLIKTQVYLETNRLDEAEKQLEEIERLGFRDITVNEVVRLKLSLMSKKDEITGCDEVFNTADKTKPDYVFVMEEYAKIQVDLGKYEEAIKIFKVIGTKVKETPENLYNMGLAYYGMDDYIESKTCLLKAFKTSQNPAIVLTLANTMYYTRDYHDAIRILLEHYTEFKDDGEVDNLLGNLYLVNNEIAEAQKFYYKALNSQPENVEFGLNLAESFYKLRDYDNAYMLTKQIVQKDALDRAKSLHLRVKSHLFITTTCKGCQTEWNISKDAKDGSYPIEEFPELPGNAPAGFCPKCGNTYCKSCTPGFPDIDSLCPVCNKTLSSDSASLRIIWNDFRNEMKEKLKKKHVQIHEDLENF